MEYNSESAAKALTEFIKIDETLKKIFSGKVNCDPLKWELSQWRTTNHPQISKIRNETEIIDVFSSNLFLR